MSTSETRRTFARALPALGAWMAITAAAPAGAQGQDEAAARALFNQGRQLVKGGHYEEACGKFEAARALFRSPGVLLNLADCHERIGKTASAWTEFGDAADAAASAGRPHDAEEARRRQSALEPALCMLDVEVEAPVAEEVVKRDGAPLDRSAWNVAIPVDPGSRTITAEAPGRKAWTSTLDVSENGKTVTVHVPALEELNAGPARVQHPAAAIKAAAPPEAAPPEPEKPVVGGAQRSLAWVVGGVGVSAMVGAGLVSIFARSQFDTAQGEQQSNPKLAASDSQHAGQLADIATGLVIGGGALAAAGLVLWLTAPRAPVTVGVNGPGVVVSGAF